MASSIASFVIALFSVLVPSKMWFTPSEKLQVKLDTQGQIQLVLSDMQGKLISTDVPTVFDGGTTVDVRATFPAMQVGTYLLYAVPKDKFQPNEPTHHYVGTPLVIELRGDTRPGGRNGPVVIRVQPLSVAKFHTAAGEMTALFYYDSAPNTVDNFVELSREGFYDGLTFHRVVPGFVVQAGDPMADNSGGPGYQIGAEFNTRQHLEGVLSMAREGDPMEAQGVMPRPEFANTAGSQFFICLDYARTKALDRKYTAFGRVVEGLDVLHKIGTGELADAEAGRPKQPVTIDKLEIAPVTADHDPYQAAIEKPVE